eukprot:TRINITY_DN12077_c0_g3_i1.p1 TRINITY_DN12077_c0_g3~~TRINITY_DN12077_c0_g3_i1.p1  ORF type:complete len:1726 (-),score=379.63 TRINITY_DN12077_c0_g3_i1:166-5343(-)
MALGDATVAVFYGIFAVMLVTINMQSQGTSISNDIHEAVMQKYISMPWNYPTTRYLSDLQTPDELFVWLETVFGAVTFHEQPVLGSDKGYCSLRFPCDVGEGHCEFDSQCKGNLTCGDTTLATRGVLANGKYWSRESLAEHCEYQGTPIDLSRTEQQCHDKDTPSPLPFCCRGQDGVPIKIIQPSPRASTPIGGNCPGNLPADIACCSDPNAGSSAMNITSAFSGARSTRPATVGAFNRIYQIRFSMKRYKTENSVRGKFAGTDADPGKTLMGDGVLDVVSHDPSVEDTKTIIDSISGTEYKYTVPGSYMEGGGYVMWVNPDDGRNAFRQQLERMKASGWFDPTLATMVVDMLIYNGNVDKFGYLDWIFKFDHLGQATYSTGFRAMNLDLFNLDVPKYSLRYAFEFVIILFICGFIFAEVMKVVEFGFFGHFRNGGALIDVVSLTLCVTAVISNFAMQGDTTMNIFTFEKLEDPATREEMYMAMESLAIRFEEHSMIVALNLLVVFVRAVMLLSQLQTNLGLIIKVMSIAFYNVLYFLVMFLMVMTGFVFFAYFTFGQRYKAMSDPLLAFNEVFAMLLGKPTYTDLEEADSLMAQVFFYLFYVVFYLVMKNVFVSILMTGYDHADYEIKHRGKEESNPFKKIINDLRVDVIAPILKLAMLIYGVLRVLASPILACLVESFGSCLPTTNPLNVASSALQSFRKQRRTSVQSSAASTAQAAARSGSPADASKEQGTKKRSDSVSFECVLMVIFMLNFVMLMQLQTRGATTYQMREATLGKSSGLAWIATPPMRTSDFENVQSMSDVYDWARRAVDIWYGETSCIGGSVDGSCDNGKDGTQLIQRVSKWNIGFLNTTFVRVTAQKACYMENARPRFKYGYPLLVENDDPEVQCAVSDCTSVQFSKSCVTAGGDNVMQHMSGLNFPIVPAGQLGPYKRNGGIAVSLGTTKMEAAKMITALSSADMFTKDTLSMVFDFVTYNGNVDMFVHNSIMFSLKTSGKFEVDVNSVAFPLNLITGGGEVELSRMIWVVLFSIYIVFVIYYTVQLVLDICREKAKCHALGKPGYYFIQSFFTQVWNISDTISTALSITSIYSLSQYVFDAFRLGYKFSATDIHKYVIPNEEVERYSMYGNTDPRRGLQDDWFIFSEFEKLSDMYGRFMTIAAMNSFFISIKVVKYVAEVSSIRVFSGTLHFGKERIIYFTIVISMMLFGFALFYSNLYGHMVTELRSPFESFMTLFEWMIGRFELGPLMMYSPLITIFSFMFFMTGFYFVAVNMYLATMMNTYSETVGKMDIATVRRRVERDRRIRVVEYPSKEALEKDITIAFAPTGEEIVVKDLLEQGLAFKFGVVKGHVIFKVNGEREEWRKVTEMAEHADKPEEDILRLIVKEGIKEDTRDGRIRVTFKDVPNKGGSIGKMMGIGSGKDESETRVVASVRNFWRTQGAVTWVYQKVLNEERAEELQDRGEEDQQESGSDEDADFGDAGEDDRAEREREQSQDVAGGTSKTARVKTKKRMDALLFSRWPEGRRVGRHEKVLERGVDGAVMVPFSGLPAGRPAEYERDLDIDALRTEVEKMPVTGEEAWLDCLLTAIEREMSDESIVTEVLRTSDMAELSKADTSSDKKSLTAFYEQADRVLDLLEFKARRKYYNCLQQESESRQDMLRRQNDVMYDYVSELEREFTRVMGSIHSLKAKKHSMLTKLAGILGGGELLKEAGIQDVDDMGALSVEM